MWVVVFIIVSLGGILYFTLGSSTKSKSGRYQFLKIIAENFNGKGERIPDKEDSYQISFLYKNKRFMYEDLINKGFKGMVNKGYLRIRTISNLSLSFLDKNVSETKAPELSSFLGKKNDSKHNKPLQLEIPKSLKMFRVVGDDKYLVNKFMNDKKVLRALNNFKGKDYRGQPTMSLKIVAGEVVVELCNDNQHKPNLINMRNNPHSFEDLADQVLVLVGALNDRKV